MKILDRYILTTFLKTFFSVFVILILIFVLQTIWLYIKELAGKDLDIIVIFKFIFYFLPKLIPLVLPLTILLSSIMVFGSFAENYEFAAMKSTGISLQRAMSGLSIFIVALGITTFFFANNVIPWAELNTYNLRKNIAKLKPAMLLAEGQFNSVNTYNIKFEKKSGDREQFLENVTIHLKGANGKINTTIKSKTGELASEKDSNVLKLILFDGNYYSDIYQKDFKKREKKPFAKSTFEKYIINIDLSDFNKVDIDEKSQTDKYSMLNVSGLHKAIDSLKDKRDREHENMSKNFMQRSGASNFKRKDQPISTKKDSTYHGAVLDAFNTTKKLQLIDIALKSFTNSSDVLSQKIKLIKRYKTVFNRHVISMHEKFALSFACIILFFVGAPLGALIRKGGIGLPMIIAVLLFLTYHFIGIFATNSAKNGEFNPVMASWFSTLVMLPLGIYFTKRATADRGLYEIGNIIDPLKKVFKIKTKNSIDYKFLNKHTNDELIDIIATYKTLGHNETTLYEALKILNIRGVSAKTLRSSRLAISENYEAVEKAYKHYFTHSKYSIILYNTGVILLLLFFIFKNNKLPSLASASIQLSLVSFYLYTIYYIKLLINMVRFYNVLTINKKSPHVVALIFAYPLYLFIYPFINLKLKEDFKQQCIEELK